MGRGRRDPIEQDTDLDTGLHNRHLDIEGGNFIRNTIAEAFQSPICCTIHAQTRRPQMSGDASKHDHMADLLLAHRGYGRLDDIYWSEEIGFELVPHKGLCPA